MEPVHFYGEYDGEIELPESGVAEFKGKPHYFWLSAYRHEGPRCAEFELAPVSPEAFPLVVEQAGIWRRWELAYHGGEVPLETWPALPADRDADTRLRAFFEADHASSRKHVFRRVGTFQTSATYEEEMAGLPAKKWPVPGWYSAELQVTWSEVEYRAV
jgi:hypothetical protein